MDEYWGDVVPFQKPPRRERRPGPYVVGLLTAVALFGFAAALAQLLPRDTPMTCIRSSAHWWRAVSCSSSLSASRP
jgi:hypothetical protein